MKMEMLNTKRTSWRTSNSQIINEASFLLCSDSATHEPLDSIYERLKANNDELNKTNVELKSLITDKDFQDEYETALEYEDNVTRTLAELRSRRNFISNATAHAADGLTWATHTISSSWERKGVNILKLAITTFSGDVPRMGGV